MSGFVLLGLVSPILAYVIGWEERFENDLFLHLVGLLCQSTAAIYLK